MLSLRVWRLILRLWLKKYSCGKWQVQFRVKRSFLIGFGKAGARAPVPFSTSGVLQSGGPAGQIWLCFFYPCHCQILDQILSIFEKTVVRIKFSVFYPFPFFFSIVFFPTCWICFAIRHQWCMYMYTWSIRQSTRVNQLVKRSILKIQ